MNVSHLRRTPGSWQVTFFRRTTIEFLCLLILLGGAPLQAITEAGHHRQLVREREQNQSEQAAIEDTESKPSILETARDWIADVTKDAVSPSTAIRPSQTANHPAEPTAKPHPAPAIASTPQPTFVSAPKLLAAPPVDLMGSTVSTPRPPRPPSKNKAGADSTPSPIDPSLKSADQIPVAAAWNLISLPKEPADPTIGTVLQSIGGQYDEVWTYNACDAADPWKLYDPSDLPGSDLATLDHKPGIWLHGMSQTTLPVDGTVPSSTTYQLCTGWNLIGYPSIEPRHPEAVLSPIDGKWVRLFGYDPFTPDDLWQGYDHQAPEWANNLPAMLSGRGYWLLVTEDTTLEIANQGAPPEIDLVTPEDLAVVTQPTDIIGTVSSSLLQDWNLSFRAVGDADWQEIGTGTAPASGEALGTFDPTLLLNGLYEIRLQAIDIAGQQVEEAIAVAVEGNMKIGHFTLSFIDLAIPLSGLDIEIIRTYDSRQRLTQGDFGYGWSLDIRQGSYRNNRPTGDGWQIVDPGGPGITLPCSQIIETKSHLTVVRLSDQEVYRFRQVLKDPATVVGGCFARAEFEYVDGPLPGTTLEILGNDEVIYEGQGSRVIDRNTLEVFEPEDVKLATRDGRIFHLDLADGVTHLEDLNGNTLEITVDGINHSSGVGINFQRDTEGRIQQITDLRGFKNTYSYDANSDLVSHRDRVGDTVEFGYGHRHFLQQVTDALGVPGVRTEFDDKGRVIRVIDASGHATELEHDLGRRREVVRNRLGYVRVLEYDGRGNVVREVDELGNETLREYDSRDHLLRILDPLMRESMFTYSGVDLVVATNATGQTFTLAYDAQGSPLSLTGPSGTMSFEYDSKKRLSKLTDPGGGESSFTYDARGNLIHEAGPIGNGFTYEYDQNGWILTATENSGFAIRYAHDSMGNIVLQSETRTGADGVSREFHTTYVLDALGRITSTTYPDGATSSSQYNEIGQLVQRTGPLGNVTDLRYDVAGRLISVIYPDRKWESRDYDAEGRLTKSTDRQGRVTVTTYDAAGRMVQKDFPDGSFVRTLYDAAGQAVQAINEAGKSTHWTYDGLGRQLSMTTAAGSVTTSTYDEAGNLASVRDASGREFRYRYDALGRRVETILPDGSRASTEYDLLGRKTASVDFARIRTEIVYRDATRRVEVRDALGGITVYAYSESGTLKSRTDAAGKVTRYEYDSRDRLTARILPDGSIERFVYDRAGQLERHTDFAGTVTVFQYDVLGRLVQRADPDGSVSFSYTASGRLASAASGASVSTYEYDLRDRLLRKTTSSGSTIEYGWTAHGLLESMSVSGGSASPSTTRYHYDDDSRLVGMEDPVGGPYSFTYDSAGRRLSQHFPNGTQTSFAYDTVGRLVSQETSSAEGMLQSLSYELGPNGNRLSMLDQEGRTRGYDYDALYRLIGERLEDAEGALQQETTYAYDAVGNRTARSLAVPGSPIATTEYRYDSRDRLILQTATGSATSFTWDANGNRLVQQGEDQISYQWSSRNELTRVAAEDFEILFGYDANGNLVRRDATSHLEEPPRSTTVQWLVDESIPTPRAIAELEHGSSLVEALYVVEPSLGAPLAKHTSTGTTYFHTDALGSITSATDPEGMLASQFSFRPFGQRGPPSGPEFGFVGEQQDSSTGLVHLRARWLDPTTGSFLSMDPFASTTEPLYAYAANNPINRVDPTGLFSVVEANIAARIATTISSIQLEVGFIVIGGIENGQAGVLSAIKTSLTFAALGAAAGLVLTGLVRIVKGLRGVSKGLKSRLYVSQFSEITPRLADLRSAKHPNDLAIVGKRRTLANAYVDVGGRRRELVGMSGRNSEDLSRVLEKSKDAGFGRPRLAPDVLDAHDGNHAENKILQLLRRELSEADSGSVVLYINHPTGQGACASCRSAIEEFSAQFKKINLIVLELQ